MANPEAKELTEEIFILLLSTGMRTNEVHLFDCEMLILRMA